MSHEQKSTGRVGPSRILGERVKEALKRKGITQRELAELVGVTQPTISGFVNGQSSVAVELLKKIAENLDTPFDALAGGLSVVVKPQEAQEPQGDDDMPEGLRGFIERNGERLHINRRELMVLSNLRFKAASWVVFNDSFWQKQLEIWRQILEEQDSMPAVVTPGTKVSKS